MNRQFGENRYSSQKIENPKEGFIGYEVTETRGNARTVVANIVFWDASGQFSVETLGTDVPLDILEEVILEAKALVTSK